MHRGVFLIVVWVGVVCALALMCECLPRPVSIEGQGLKDEYQVLGRVKRQSKECRERCLRIIIRRRLSRVGKPSVNQQFQRINGWSYINNYRHSFFVEYQICIAGCLPPPTDPPLTTEPTVSITSTTVSSTIPTTPEPTTPPTTPEPTTLPTTPEPTTLPTTPEPTTLPTTPEPTTLPTTPEPTTLPTTPEPTTLPTTPEPTTLPTTPEPTTLPTTPEPITSASTTPTTPAPTEESA